MNLVNEKISRSEKTQGHRGHRKVKCEIKVIINLHMKFIVHSSNVNQVIVPDRQTDRQHDDNTIGIRKNFAET